MIQLDYKSGVPIYDQLVNGIIKLETLGALKSGDSLPSVRALASELGINPNTVQRAYALLESKGVICSVSGKGSFITDSEESKRAIIEMGINDFRKAVISARQIGISEDDALSVVEEVYREGNL